MSSAQESTEARRNNTKTRQTKSSFSSDNIFPPYSIVMSHVAVEGVHGLEQQVNIQRVLHWIAL